MLPGNTSTVMDALATLEPSVRKRVKTVGTKRGSAKTTPNSLKGAGGWGNTIIVGAWQHTSYICL